MVFAPCPDQWSMPPFVHIKLAGGFYGEVSIREDDTIYRVAKRACAEFPGWRVEDPTQLCLYLVASGGDCTPTPSAEAAASYLGEPGWSLERAGVSPGAWLFARVSPPSPAPTKDFTLMVSSEDMWGELVPTQLRVAISTDRELRELIDDHGKGSLAAVGSTVKVRGIEEIVDGGTYTLIGGQQRTFLDKQQWTQQADRMLEEVATLTVRDAIEKSTGWPLDVYVDVTLKNKWGVEKQFDGLLLSSTTAIVVEAKHTAQLRHVPLVVSKREFLLDLAQESKTGLLEGITAVIPVLASPRISNDVIDLCEASAVGTVVPNGSGHSYTPFATPPPSLRLPLIWRSSLQPPLARQRGSLHAFTGQRSIHTLARVLRLLL